MNTNRLRTVLVLLLAPLVAAPTIANASGYFSLHVGNAGGGFAIGSTDWAIFGASWHDAAWGISYESHLAGYGEWVRVDGIGQVWRPWVAPGWRPYTHGRWVWTDAGWTWIAYEPWGYVPHHYGNWAMTTFGWVWVPGWTYRPATVSWVTCGSYVGWYPTAPHGWVHSERSYRHGWSNGYRTGYDNGYHDGWRDARYATWVPWGHLGDDNISRHAVSYQNVSHTRGAPPTRTIAAPDRTEVVRRGVTVPHTTLERRTVSAGDRQITVARPKGFTGSVETHGEDTVRHALSTRANRSPREREASQPTTSRVPSARSYPGGRTATVDPYSTEERHQPRSDRGQARRPTEEGRRDPSPTQPLPAARHSYDRPPQETNRARHQTAPADRDRRPTFKSDRRSPESGEPRIPGEAVIHRAPRGDAPQSTRRSTDAPPAAPRRKSPGSAGKSN